MREETLLKIPHGSPSSSSVIIHGTKNGIIPANAWYHSEFQVQLEKSISVTPKATQCVGGFFASPSTRRTIAESPTRKVATEPIHREITMNEITSIDERFLFDSTRVSLPNFLRESAC